MAKLISNKKLLRKTLAIIMVITLLVTSYILIIPALTLEQQTYCGFEEHLTHTDACMSNGEIICGKPVHEHTLQCYSNPDADVEDEDDWHESFADALLTGDYADDTLEIAKMQIGYTESENNYLVESDGKTKKGYTRYGDWFGSPYADWNTLMCSFCMNFAGVSGLISNADSSNKMLDSFKGMNLFYTMGSYDPAGGDILFADKDLDGIADYSGIVSDINENEIICIAGDVSNSVSTIELKKDDNTILGFGSVKEYANRSKGKVAATENISCDNDDVNKSITKEYKYDNSFATISSKGVGDGNYDEAIEEINYQLGLGNLSIGGDIFNNYFYYGLVAQDSRVPFNNADEYAEFLAQLYLSEGIEAVRRTWNYYLYDLYDPDFVKKYDNSGDQDLLWPKASGDGDSFHSGTTPSINNLDYNYLENGVDYSNFMNNLHKSATTVKPGDENTERKYNVDVSADAQARIKAPVVLLLQIQTSWQMFDMLHGNAQKGDGKTQVGSVAYNTELANLYDIKHALLRFTEYMETNYPGRNLVMGITEVRHGGSDSMFNKDAYGNSLYVTNDINALREGIEGFDVFGNCEHVHYDTKTLQTACKVLPQNLSGWQDFYGHALDYDEIQKAAIIIGGPTENTNGTNGYGCTLPWSSFQSAGLNSVYGIRTNNGTPCGNAPVISWIDYKGNKTGDPFNNGNGTTYTKEYVATNEDAILASLIQIAEEEVSKKGIDITAKDKFVENVTITDTVRREFLLDNSQPILAIIKDSEGNVVEQKEVSVSDPDLEIVYNADGTTTLTYNFNEVHNCHKCILHFEIVAREDFIGSNNVYTNIGTPSLSYEHTPTDEYGNPSGDLEKHEIECFDTPMVNVPVRFSTVNGEAVSVFTGTDVDLGDLGKEIPKAVEELLDNYSQINGSLSYTWIMPDGSLVSIGEVEVKDGIPSGLPDISTIFTPQTTGNYTGTLSLTFKPKEADSESEHFSNAATAQPVSELTKVGYVWVDAVSSDEPRSLVVKKHWEIYPNWNNPSVDFQIISNGTPLEQTYTLDESNDWEITIPNLPATEEINGVEKIIQYTVQETPVPQGYSATYSDEYDTENIWAANAEFLLCIKDDKKKVVRVDIECTTSDGSVYKKSYPVSGLYKNTDYTFEMNGLPIDENGNPQKFTSYTFTAYNNKGQEETIKNIIDWEYELSKYISSIKTTHYLTISNKPDKQSVTITKSVIGEQNSDGFLFELEVMDYSLPSPDKDAPYTVENGKAYFRLNNNESITLDNIPQNSNVSIRETEHDGYTVFIKENGVTLADNDIIRLDNVDKHHTIDFYNQSGYELPNTGGKGMEWLLISGAILIGASIYIIYMRRRAGRRKEE